jgi:hypothetical protein
MYRTVAQLDFLTGLLAGWFPQFFMRLQLPENSVEGRPIYAFRMRAGGGEDRRGVLLVGGTHARELINPDAIVELAVDMLVSYALNRDIAYGGRTWPASDIRIILETADPSLRKTYGYTYENRAVGGRCARFLPSRGSFSNQAGRQVGNDCPDAAVHLCHRADRLTALEPRHRSLLRRGKGGSQCGGC